MYFAVQHTPVDWLINSVCNLFQITSALQAEALWNMGFTGRLAVNYSHVCFIISYCNTSQCSFALSLTYNKFAA